MTDREKLIKLIKEGECGALALEDCSYCKYDGEDDCSYQLLAEVLIANGVTFATDNHVGGKWIPATERLPEEGQDVIVCILHRFGDKTVCWTRFWGETHFSWQDVTHWMPLPEPPKEGE